MADFLEILIGADLKANAITDIQQKIDKLIHEYHQKEITLKLDTNEIDDVVNISQALANLNQQVTKIAQKQKQMMEHQKVASKDVLATAQKISQEE